MNQNASAGNGMDAATNIRQNEQQNVRQNEKMQERQNEKVEEKQGVVTRNFEFQKQKERVEQILQKPRSQEYLAAMDMLDFLSSDDEAIMEKLKENMGEEFVEELEEMTDEEIFEMITKSIHEEFAEMETTYDNTLIAVLSKCYIDGCDCHAIDSDGHILDHYRINAKLSSDIERGRNLFRQYESTCQCVEIYKSCCRVISRTGEVETIEG